MLLCETDVANNSIYLHLLIIFNLSLKGCAIVIIRIKLVLWLHQISFV